MSDKHSTKKKLTRKQARDMDVEISFLEGVIRRDPEYVEALQILGDDYTRCGKVKESLRVDKQLAHLCPKDSMVHYNLACSYALIGKFDRAVASLEQALTLGYRDFRWLEKDPDLGELRKHPLYEVIENRIRKIAVKVD